MSGGYLRLTVMSGEDAEAKILAVTDLLLAPADAPPDRLSWTGRLVPAELQIQAGQTLLLQAFVVDLAPRAPEELGHSDIRRIRVVSADALKQLIDQDRLVITRMLDDVRDDVETQRKRLAQRSESP